ncbi:MAG: HTTM domain-containing protein [Deltaproteobacteria bacterium]|nr:HTTM domain-containing protein [Deltaproteobacteria bacterium]
MLAALDPLGLTTIAPQPGLEVFRILFGLVCTLYFAQRLRSAGLCLGPGGLSDNLWRARGQPWRLSPFAWLPRSTRLAQSVLLLGLLGSLGVALGFSVPWCAAVVFGTQLILTAELSFLATGIDFIVLMMNGLLALSEAGAALALDAPVGLADTPATAVWATRLMQLQICAIYSFTVVQKLIEHQWRSGWAVYYAVQALVVARRWSHRLAAWPLAPRLLTWATLVVQVVAPFALWWEPTRLWALALLLGLHLGLDLCLRLWPFQWLMLASLPLFIQPSDLGWP